MKVEWIEEALRRGGSDKTVEYVLNNIERGHSRLFSNDKAFGLVEFLVSPRHKVAHVWLAGGDINDGGMEAYRKLVPIMEDFGISNGCDIAGGTGRKGWLRAMQDMGYSPSEPAVEKELG